MMNNDIFMNRNEVLVNNLKGYEEILLRYSDDHLLENVVLPDGSIQPRWMILKERAQ